MGTSFVGKVRDVRQIVEAQIGEGVADMVEFEAQVSEHEATEKANRIQAWQGLLDWQLADRFERDRPVILLPGSWWSGQHEPEFESAGWLPFSFAFLSLFPDHPSFLFLLSPFFKLFLLLLFLYVCVRVFFHVCACVFGYSTCVGQ